MKGFSQVEGLDFNQVFSPVVCFETVCLILTLAALENWYITGLDIRSAYLYGKLDEEIYMEQPEGFSVPGVGTVLSLGAYLGLVVLILDSYLSLCRLVLAY